MTSIEMIGITAIATMFVTISLCFFWLFQVFVLFSSIAACNEISTLKNEVQILQKNVPRSSSGTCSAMSEG